MRRWSCFMLKKSSSRVGWSFSVSRCMFGCPDWPAVHSTLLVPIKLPPYRPPLHRASDWSWKVLRSKSPAGRMKIKQGCNNFLAGTVLDSQELYDWGVWRVTTPSIIYEAAGRSFDTISLWPAISSLMMQWLVGRQLYPAQITNNETQFWKEKTNTSMRLNIQTTKY